MGRYSVIKSPVNEAILSMLGVEYVVEGSRIVFEWEASGENVKRLASMLMTLGYAHDEPYAYRVAASFFLNRLD